MAWWKQAIGVVAVTVAAIFGWARLVPEARGQLSSSGFPPALIALLAGAEPVTQTGAVSKPNGAPGARATAVRTAEVFLATINDRVEAIGDGEALRSVTVVPLSSGVLAEVRVASGAQVASGDVLARLDSAQETLARDKAALTLKTADTALQRAEQLFRSRTATQSALDDARAARDTAQLALREAELALMRRSIVAPMEGHVGIVPVEAGDYVTTQSEIVTLDDRSSILVEFWLPERFATQIAAGLAVRATAVSLPGEEFAGTVSAVGSRIDRASRTFQVQALLGNGDDRLKPGMSFRIALAFRGQDFPAVDPLAVQWSSGGAFVWKVVEGKASRVAVSILQRNSDSVLVDAPGLAAGDRVVTEGVQVLREGAALKDLSNASPEMPAREKPDA
ncbi:MAG: efflux RND transporter periplasmic adaptor subunit [Notoacmeibacter sp.]|nr:efflux RND transporter periplasmic adaptor subunit [Notoacmeibacter sp.]MCC0033256.1 efflux RND transporter periplasmic adaptor subunit [Brucellaceae bacterium]